MTKEKQIEEMSDIIYENSTADTMWPEIDAMAMALYNAGYRKQSEWISVDERLPQEGVDVLVALRIGDRLTVDTDRIYGGRWFSYGSRGYRGSGYVTYWMPFPEPPKGGT